jgi:Putative amidase domain
MEAQELLKSSIYERLQLTVGSEVTPTYMPLALQKTVIKMRDLFHHRSATIVKCNMQGRVENIININERNDLYYVVHVQYLIKQKDFFYIQEDVEERCCRIYNGKIEQDFLIVPVQKDMETVPLDFEEDVKDEHTRFSYNRLEAVKYAELWWNANNPQYVHFKEENCTNYISQCLHAGGAPMIGYPSKAKGWWIRGRNWSYSWTSAHALRWYLSGAKSGLRAKKVEKPSDLLIGDVIFYDFEGDGHWNHSTIIVAKDMYGMPLVNAHTINSRYRYWTYEDSPRYTPNIQYIFFQILDSKG